MSDWLLGIDAGLTNVKAAVYDATGRERSVAVADPSVADSTPEPDHEERDPAALWDVVTGVVAEAIEGAPAGGEDIDGVGITAHGHGLYALDGDGEPVRPGIKSTDGRAAGVHAEWAEHGLLGAVASIAGYRPFVGDPLSLLAWLKREEPDAYGEIETVLFCKDYLKYRLTGEICTDEMEASVFGDVETGGYSRELFERLDLEGVADALPPAVSSWEACGEVTLAAARETGLAAGTPVASGLHDVGATALGAGVHRPGQAMLIVGTWGQSIVVDDAPRTSGEAISRRFLGDAWLLYRGNRSAATCADWFTDRFCADWRRRAEEEGISPYDVYDREVASAPPGAGGLLFHPFLHGSTTRPAARAGFYGLTESHTRAHMLRAVYEGVAIEQCEGVRAIVDPAALSAVRLGGGGARSEVWAGIFADALGEPIAVADGEEMGARGAAICAAIAAGVHPSHEAAVEAMVGVERTHAPDPEHAETYRSVREAFVGAADGIEPTWDRLAALRGRSGPTDGADDPDDAIEDDADADDPDARGRTDEDAGAERATDSETNTDSDTDTDTRS